MSSFSDRLTPKQIQQVLDALKLPWREYYNPDNDGWVNIPVSDFNSDLSVNIQHGGFVDQYCAGHPDPMMDGIPIRGDLITLVAWMNWENAEATSKAIEWVMDVLGMGNGVKPPELKDGRLFAKDFKACGGGKHVRIPKELMRSNLTASEKLVWGWIFDRCGKDESGEDKIYSFPGFRKLSKDTGLAIGTVQKAVKNLIQYGLLIEKHRGKGKAPARFPLIAEEAKINESIKRVKNTVSDSEHTRTKYRTPPVSNSELNYTHSTRPNKLNPNSIKSKAEAIAHSGYLFLSEEQEEAFLSVLAQIGIEDMPKPPTSYSNLFRDTFMVAPYGINQFTGEVFDKRGYPRSWDNISEGYYPRSKPITAVA